MSLGDCALVSWLATLPKDVTPKPRPGFEGKGPLRAGYLGHVTRIGQVLQEAGAQQQEVADALKDSNEWQSFVQQELGPRLELEDVTHWQCGRPANAEGGDLDSDGDDFQVGIGAGFCCRAKAAGVPSSWLKRSRALHCLAAARWSRQILVCVL